MSITTSLDALSAGPTSNADSLHTHSSGLSRTLFTISAAGSAVTNTAAETSLLPSSGSIAGSKIIQANTLKVGNIIRVTAFSTWANNGVSSPLTLRLKLGSTTVFSHAITLGAWSWVYTFRLMADLVCRSVGSTGSIVGTDIVISDVGLTASLGSSVTVDTTANQTFDFTNQWGSASSGTSMQLQSISVEVI